MTWLNRISSLFLMAFALLIFFSSMKLGVGTLESPGPGFMACLASILLFILSLVVLVSGTKGTAKDKAKTITSFIHWTNLKKPVSLVIGLSGYTLLLKPLGYLITIFLLMFTLFFIYAPRKWYVHLIVAAIIANLSFLVFYKWLRVQLPAGLLTIW